MVKDDPFFAKQMVNFSFLRDEGRPADVFYRYRRDTLVNALQMAVLPLISGVISLSIGLAGNEASIIHPNGRTDGRSAA
jgi:hypothetical protein